MLISQHPKSHKNGSVFKISVCISVFSRKKRFVVPLLGSWDIEQNVKWDILYSFQYLRSRCKNQFWIFEKSAEGNISNPFACFPWQQGQNWNKLRFSETFRKTYSMFRISVSSSSNQNSTWNYLWHAVVYSIDRACNMKPGTNRTYNFSLISPLRIP